MDKEAGGTLLSDLLSVGTQESTQVSGLGAGVWKLKTRQRRGKFLFGAYFDR